MVKNTREIFRMIGELNLPTMEIITIRDGKDLNITLFIIKIIINNTKIYSEDVLKYLGIRADTRLKYETRITYSCNKAEKLL